MTALHDPSLVLKLDLNPDAIRRYFRTDQTKSAQVAKMNDQELSDGARKAMNVVMESWWQLVDDVSVSTVEAAQKEKVTHDAQRS